MLNDDELWNIATGREYVRKGEGLGPDDFETDPAFWAELWRTHKVEVLRDWLSRDCGTRPPAYWRFQADDRREDESEVAYLARTNELGPDEIAAIVTKTRELAEFNARYQRGDRLGHFIEPDSLSPIYRWCCEAGLVDAQICQILFPDERIDTYVRATLSRSVQPNGSPDHREQASHGSGRTRRAGAPKRRDRRAGSDA
jgi:hypothetical protein